MTDNLRFKAIWPISIGTRIAILGLGKTGQTCLKLLLQMGWERQKLAVWDDKSENSEVDFRNSQDLLTQFKPDAFLVSPGVPLGSGWVSQLPQDSIFSEMDLSFSFLRKELIVGITGSAGKSTTTALLGEALKAQGQSFFLGGNLGTPLAAYALDLVNGLPNSQSICLEVSSYQLENFHGNFDFSAIVSLHPNHLDRYLSLQHYYDTKWNLVRRTIQACFLAQDGGDLQMFAQQQPEQAGCHWVKPTPVSEKIALLGKKNRQNHALAKVLAQNIAKALKIEEDGQKTLAEFRGLPHRFENCGKISGSWWINDSKATSVEALNSSLETARECFPGQRICLLLGGKDKSLDWENVRKQEGSVKFIFFGEAGFNALKNPSLQGPFYSKLSEALEDWKSWARDEDVILLSPGGASQDEFSNFESRGKFFKKFIKSL